MSIINPTREFVELNKKKHDRNTFDCNKESLNDFLKKNASQNMKAGVSKTFVLPAEAAEGEKAAVCSFYTLTPSQIERETIPDNKVQKSLPRYPVPVILIGQLAVNSQCQGQGLGEITLIKALNHCVDLAEKIAFQAVVVDVLDDDAEKFYDQYGFLKFEKKDSSEKLRLYMPMKTIKTLFGTN